MMLESILRRLRVSRKSSSMAISRCKELVELAGANKIVAYCVPSCYMEKGTTGYLENTHAYSETRPIGKGSYFCNVFSFVSVTSNFLVHNPKQLKLEQPLNFSRVFFFFFLNCRMSVFCALTYLFFRSGCQPSVVASALA
jgi:hypothetical protein